MCGFSTPSTPTPPPVPEPPPEAPTEVSEEVQQARRDEKKAARAAAGRSGQIKTTSDINSEEVNTASRTILG